MWRIKSSLRMVVQDSFQMFLASTYLEKEILVIYMKEKKTTYVEIYLKAVKSKV